MGTLLAMSWTTDEIVPLVGMAADFVRVAMETTDTDAAELQEAVNLLKPLPGGLRSAIALQALKQERCTLDQAENLARMLGGEFTAEMFSEVDKHHRWSYDPLPNATGYYPELMGALSLGTVRNWLLEGDDSGRVKWVFASWFVRKAKELDEWDENSPDDQRIAAIVDPVEGSSSESDSDEMTRSTDDEYESG